MKEIIEGVAWSAQVVVARGDVTFEWVGERVGSKVWMDTDGQWWTEDSEGLPLRFTMATDLAEDVPWSP